MFQMDREPVNKCLQSEEATAMQSYRYPVWSFQSVHTDPIRFTVPPKTQTPKTKRECRSTV